MKNLLVALLFMLSITGFAQIKKIDYKGTPGFVLEKTPDDFPQYFMNKAICEDNLAESNAKARCIKLNSDGTGTFQNDYFSDRDLPATPIRWYVVCNDAGETLKFEGGRSNSIPGDYRIYCELL